MAWRQPPWRRGWWPETSCLGPRAGAEAQVFSASHPGAKVGARGLLPRLSGWRRAT
ncbi:hypothetical protein E2562_002917, partial [Oryza meyeriana var. granulata]